MYVHLMYTHVISGRLYLSFFLDVYILRDQGGCKGEIPFDHLR